MEGRDEKGEKDVSRECKNRKREIKKRGKYKTITGKVIQLLCFPIMHG